MRTGLIADRKVGKNHPVYVIAEVGINHNGDLTLAKETIDAALESGADAVKLQVYTTGGFVHPENPIFQAVKSCELSRHEYAVLFEHARERNGVIFATPECLEDIHFLKSLDPPAIKVAAMDMNYKEFIQEAAKTMKPIILSSGMSYLYEVARTVRWIEETGNDKIILLHCVSCYPTPVEECNLSAISHLEQSFGYPAGFSDHTIGIEVPFAAACLGARVIEKHFTLDKNLPGPDHSGSADPADLKKLITALRTYEKALGDGIKKPSTSEKITRLKKRRSIYAAQNLSAGDILEPEDTVLLTPSTPESRLEDLDSFLGRTLKVDISQYEIITKSVFKKG